MKMTSSMTRSPKCHLQCLLKLIEINAYYRTDCPRFKRKPQICLHNLEVEVDLFSIH